MLLCCSFVLAQKPLEFCGSDSLITYDMLKQCNKLTFKNNAQVVVLPFSINIIKPNHRGLLEFICNGNTLPGEFLAFLYNNPNVKEFTFHVEKTKNKATGYINMSPKLMQSFYIEH